MNTMNNMKKFASILLALVMVLAMAAPAMADTVVNNTANHTYNIYQVFSGTQGDQASKNVALGDVVWGTGVDHVALLATLKADSRFGEGTANIFATANTAADVADALDDVQNDSAIAKAFADDVAKHTTVVYAKVDGNKVVDDVGAEKTMDAGYYLFVDTTTPATGDAMNAALLQVTKKGEITIDVKYDAPEVEKTVDDNDANIGDTVTFTLTATMPSNLEGYDTYKVVFHDTMSAGLAYTNNVKVTIDGKEIAAETDNGDGAKIVNYTVVTGDYTATEEGDIYAGGTTITVTMDDVKALGADVSDKIVVTYTAIVDTDAVIGTAGNPNKVVLEYSNNPNGEGTGNTQPSEEKVYTWKLPAEKVDADNDKPLADAEFKLSTDAEGTKVVNLVKLTRVVKETVVENEQTVEKEVTHTYYQVCTKADCGHTHVQIKTDATGEIVIEGLQRGTYYLTETKAPAGYNILTAPIQIIVGANGAISVVEGETTTPADVVTIENTSGRVLPETGGMGTTMFYALGSLLIVGAALVLLNKKRIAA